MKWLNLASFVAVVVGAMGCTDASQTIAALIPLGAPIHEEDSEGFGDVTFTHIEYGELLDCASGCFSSHLCAIEDGTNVLLYLAFWNQPSEAPKGIATICPGLQGFSTNGCNTPGKQHPFGSSSELTEFLSEEMQNGGPFRWCAQ